jgi:thioredoxin 1
MPTVRDATEQADFDDALCSPKPLVVDFYTPQCTLCKKLEPMLAVLGEDLGDTIDVIKVDAAANLSIAAKYNVQGVPTLLVLDGGKVLDRKSGFMTKSMLRKWIDSVL